MAPREGEVRELRALMVFRLSQLIGIAKTAGGAGDGRDWKRLDAAVEHTVDELFTWRTMYFAWRKRAEEAERSLLAAAPSSGGEPPMRRAVLPDLYPADGGAP